MTRKKSTITFNDDGCSIGIPIMGCISDRNPKARKILCMIETTAIFHCSVAKKRARGSKTTSKPTKAAKPTNYQG